MVSDTNINPIRAGIIVEFVADCHQNHPVQLLYSITYHVLQGPLKKDLKYISDVITERIEA